jgi:GDP-D-mannose 3', 5'-epimerase
VISTALVAGGGGFIGGHLVHQLLRDGVHVTAVDVRPLAQWQQAHPGAVNICADLMDPASCSQLAKNADIIYHFAADVGGVGYITNHNWQCAASVQITQNLLAAALRSDVTECLFLASSACVYPTRLQSEGLRIPLREDMVLPAEPEGGYGWAKLYSERLCDYARSSGLQVRIARFFNVYGPYSDTSTFRAKAPAALCYKFVVSKHGSSSPPIDIWGDGTQIRSFLYIDDCLEAIRSITNSTYTDPINVASDEIVTISEMANTIAEISETAPRFQYLPHMPRGVSTRIPCLDLAYKELGWVHKTSLQQGLRSTFEWIAQNAQ